MEAQPNEVGWGELQSPQNSGTPCPLLPCTCERQEMSEWKTQERMKGIGRKVPPKSAEMVPCYGSPQHPHRVSRNPRLPTHASAHPQQPCQVAPAQGKDKNMSPVHPPLICKTEISPGKERLGHCWCAAPHSHYCFMLSESVHLNPHLYQKREGDSSQRRLSELYRWH